MRKVLGQGWNRFAALVRRRSAAKALGIRYSRGSEFVLPTRIVRLGTEYTLDIPNEQGVRVAFAEILLDDCYGLRSSFEKVDVKTILDVGANVGLFSLAARLAYPAAT